MEYTCKDAIEMLADVATVIIAGIALYYAWLTYGVAKEAKDEWKNEKNLDVLVKFSKLFPSSREFIINLRNPFTLDQEIRDQIKFSNENGNELGNEFIDNYSSLLVLQSRYRQYELKLNHLFDLEYESIFVLGEKNVITNYILFIKKCKEDILQSGERIGYYNILIADRQTLAEERLLFKEKRKYHTERAFSIGDDQISNDLNKYYRECESFLKSHQAKFKIT